MGRWRQLEIRNKTVSIFEPAITPRFAILYLHSIQEETLEHRPAFVTMLEQLKLACVCPNGKQTWWTDRRAGHFDPEMSAERFLLDGILPLIDRELGLRPRGIGLLGVSMGGQGALRLAFRHPHIFPVTAAISPTIEYHTLHGLGSPLDEMYVSREQARQDTVPMHVPPSHPPPHIFFSVDRADEHWAQGCDRLHEKLRALGVEHEYDTRASAGGHAWSYFDALAERALRFLQSGLELESRRLL